MPLAPGSVLYTHNLTKGDTMSKSKSLFWDEAEAYADKLIEKINDGKMSIADAAKDLINSNVAYQLLGVDNQDDAEEMFWYETGAE